MRQKSFGFPFVIATSLLLAAALPGCGQKASGDDDSNSRGAKSSGGQTSAGGSSASGTGGTGVGGGAGTNVGTGGSTSGGSSGSGTGGTATSAGGTAGALTGGSAGTTAASGGAPAAGAGGTGGSSNAGASASAGTSMGGSGQSMAGASGSAGMTGTGGASPGGCVDPTDFTNWTSGKGPSDIGPLAVTNFKSHTGDDYGGAGYALAFTWFGALVFTETTGNTADNMTLIKGFEPYATGSKTVDNSASATVDSRAFGTLPLEIYMDNQDDRCKTLGLARADTQWAMTTSDGITSDARYWSDDMFMITGLQVRAYRATKDSKYLDRSAKTLIAYMGKLQQSDGMFWHTQQSKAYWGRANGWFVSGMTELLLDLPSGDTRDTIMAGYKKFLDGILPLQISGGADDGAWRQVLDLSSSNAEMSCTAMFTFALISGVRNGWLTDPKYTAAARKGWIALGNKTNASGQLDKVCPGTGQADAGSLQSQQQFYASITLGSNDMHGQAPLLWSANALLRKDCPGVR
jgi:rhamnogalacturonyl hydrolase YesR